MPRFNIDQKHAMIGNTIDLDGVVIEFNSDSHVRFSTYVVKPNGNKYSRNCHYTLSEASKARDAKLAERRAAMTYELEITACG